MRIAYVSTYLPKQCGIATYTDYLIHGVREADPASEIRIVAEQGASPIEENGLEVTPAWDRDEDYVEPIIAHTKGADVVHVQHEYSIYKFDDRLPSVLRKLDANAKKVITIHCVRPSQFSERGAVDEDFAARIAQLADQVIVHLESQQAILERLGVPSEKIRVIPHGTELSDEDKEASRKRLELPADAKLLVMFGLGKERACLENYVSEVWPLVSEDGVRFARFQDVAIRGDGSEHDDFAYGIEDIRIVRRGRTYLLVGCGKTKPPFKGANADRIAVYSTEDFVNITYRGMVESFDSRNAAPFSEPVNGRHHVLLRFHPNVHLDSLEGASIN